MRDILRRSARDWAGRAALPIVTAVTVFTLAACNSLLDVAVPSRIPAGGLENPANAVLLSNGAIADFDCAMGSYVVVAGELTDEFEDATQTAARWVYDRRLVPSDQQNYAENGCDAEGTYVPLNQARESADNVLRIVSGATQDQLPVGINRDSLIATLAAYGAYSRLLLGEMFCSSVISFVNPDGTITYGTELTPAQMLRSADSSFTKAIASAQTSGNTVALNMAYIGLARTLLDLAVYDSAKAVASLVTDPTFAAVSTASSTTDRRQNRVWSESNNVSVASSVGPRYQNMMYNGVADPRVKAARLGQDSGTGIDDWFQLKYPDVGSPIPIAHWSEAQLIIAEVEVRGGDAPGAITIINALHAAAGLPAYNGATDGASVLAQVIEERSRELFLEGQRLGDVIRNNLPLLPAPGTHYRNGGDYGPAGSALCLKLPDIERSNNPNLNH